MKKLILILGTLATSLSTFVLANPLPSHSTPHIWHTTYVQQGEWHAQLQVINEADKAWFVLPDGATKISAFDVAPSNPQKVGLFLDYAQKPDFDLAYTVTLVKKDNTHSNMTSKSCIFLVTATGPAKPDISVHAYNGANCSWKVAERGEDFYAA